MKKLLVFGSFFLVSFVTGLVGLQNADADTYGGDGYAISCTSATSCVDNYSTGKDPVDPSTTVCCHEFGLKTGKAKL